MADGYRPFGLLNDADEEDLARYLQAGGGGVSPNAEASPGYDAIGRVAYGMTGAGVPLGLLSSQAGSDEGAPTF